MTAGTVERSFEGFYAGLDQVRSASGVRHMVKRFRRRGIAEPESRALALLRAHTPVGIAVPALLGMELDGTGETLVLSYIDGEPAGNAQNLDAVAEQIIDVVTHWHTQRGTAFEDLEGAQHPDFVSAYRADITRLSDWLRTADRFDETVRHRILALVADVPALLAPLSDDTPVFIHDDAHAGNFLAADDRLVGVIDPGRARFTHRELDVFHLADAGAALDLLPRYLARAPLAPGWEQRRLLFSIWDDVKHARDADWRDDAWFTTKLDAFEKASSSLGPQ